MDFQALELVDNLTDIPLSWARSDIAHEVSTSW